MRTIGLRLCCLWCCIYCLGRKKFRPAAAIGFTLGVLAAAYHVSGSYSVGWVLDRLLCAACVGSTQVLWKWFFSLFKKTDAAMKRDLDELTVGPPNIRLASLGRLRSSVETNWAEILTHIALDLGDKLGVCMLHKVPAYRV